MRIRKLDRHIKNSMQYLTMQIKNHINSKACNILFTLNISYKADANFQILPIFVKESRRLYIGHFTSITWLLNISYKDDANFKILHSFVIKESRWLYIGHLTSIKWLSDKIRKILLIIVSLKRLMYKSNKIANLICNICQRNNSIRILYFTVEVWSLTTLWILMFRIPKLNDFLE